MKALYVIAGLGLGAISLAWLESAQVPGWAIKAMSIGGIIIGVLLCAWGHYCEKRQAHDDHMEEVELQLKYQHPQGVPASATNPSPQPSTNEKGGG